MKLIILIQSMLVLALSLPAMSANVRVTGEKGNWGLTVNGKPFSLKGVGCGLATGRDGTDYLKLAKELNANVVRTWGITQGDQEYLDKAHKYGLFVNAGIWVNWVTSQDNISYVNPTEETEKIRSDALAYVRKYKNHPAILMWNVGNEAIIFTEAEDEKIAVAKFIENLIKEIKKEDPTHPVIYAAAGPKHLKLIKKHIPSLDIIGVNTYGTVGTVQSVWSKVGFDIPYAITEFGPRLPYDSRKDENNMPIEAKDHDKAMMYRGLAREIIRLKGNSLGGFVFHLGDTTQESLTWWNLTYGDDKKQSFLDMAKIYSEKPSSIKAPRIKSLFVSNVKDVSPGSILDAKVELSDKNTKGLKYEFALSSAKYGILMHYPNEIYEINIVKQSGGTIKLKAPDEPGIYRLYCFVRGKNQTIATINKTIKIN